jgi:hypothetical protein
VPPATRASATAAPIADAGDTPVLARASLASLLNDERPLDEILAEKEKEGAKAQAAAESANKVAAVQDQLPPGFTATAAGDGVSIASPQGEQIATGDPAEALRKAHEAAAFPRGTGRQESPVQAQTPHDLALAGSQIDQTATPGQLEAGNYAKGHVSWNGLDIALETPKGGTRTAADGSWSVPDYPAHYGYVKGSEGRDGDHVDVFMGDNPQSATVYVIDQKNADGSFDEHKAILGADSEQEAASLYRSAYTDGVDRIGAITAMPVSQFKNWVMNGDTKQPIAYQPAPVIQQTAIAKLDAYISGSGSLDPGKVALAVGVTPGQARFLLQRRVALGQIMKNPMGRFIRHRAHGQLNVISFLQSRGGVRDDEGHDLAKGRDAQRFNPAFGALIRRNGMSLDDAGELLHEAGYFGDPASTPRPTVPQVLDLLDQNLGGRRTHSLADTGAILDRQERDQKARARDLADQAAQSAIADIGLTVRPDELEAVVNLMTGLGYHPLDALDEVLERAAIQQIDGIASRQENDAYGTQEPQRSPAAQPTRAIGPRSPSSGRGEHAEQRNEIARAPERAPARDESRPAPGVSRKEPGQGAAAVAPPRSAQHSGETQRPHTGPKSSPEPRAVDFEQFAAEHSASRQDFGDAGLHRGRAGMPNAQRDRALARQDDQDRSLEQRRSDVRREYDAAVAGGEIRPLSSRERLEATAAGHPDNEATKAAQRALEKRQGSTERTEQGTQHIIPGAERIADREHAERKIAEPMRARAPQKAADEGLFDTGARNQNELFQASIDLDGFLQRVEHGQWDDRKLIPIGPTPAVFQALGAQSRPVAMQPAIAKKVMERHGIPRETLAQLPAALERPIMVFDSATEPNALVALLDLTHNGQHLIAAVHLERQHAQFIINRVSSVYPKDTVRHWIDAGLLRYVDRAKVQAWLEREGAPNSSAHRPEAGAARRPTELSSLIGEPARGTRKVLTDADVFKSGTRERREPTRVTTHTQVQVTPEFARQRAALFADLKALARQILGKRANVAVFDTMNTAQEGHPITGAYNGADRLVALALADANGAPRTADQLVGTLLHEGGIHYFRDLGVIPPAQWRILSNRAKEWRREFQIDERYGHYADRGLSGPQLEDLLNEEAIAEAIARYHGGQRFAPGLDTIMGNFWRFIDRVRNFLAGRGFRDWGDVFRNISTGRLAPEADRLAAGTGRGESMEQQPDRLSPAFYSKLQREVQAAPQAKASGNQWLATLRNKGVKDEELAWTGADEFLKGVRPVTKAELQDFLQQNQVDVREVVKGEGQAPEIQPFTIHETEHQWVARTADGEQIAAVGKGTVSGREEAGDYLRRYIGQRWAENSVEHQRASAPKYAAHTLPGGANYRELLLTLPERGKRTITPSKSPEGWGTTDGGTEGVEVADDGLDFRKGHFEEPNVLAHIRFDDRTDADGKRVLLIEEIQSDWHQKGRRSGYIGERKVDPSKLTLARVEHFDTGPKYWWHYDGPMTDGLKPDFPSWGATEDEAREAALKWLTNVGTRDKSGAVPDAPFKTTWQELAFRRAVKWAADNGYDRIAWTTGEQQSARYDLSKQVDHLLYQKNADGTYRVSAQSRGRGHMLGDHLTEAQLEDQVGKDVARRIVDGAGEEVNLGGPGTTSQPKDIYRRLSGIDLAVGGEGMKGFYDKILPSFAQKLGKKFGAKVGATEVSTNREGSDYEGPEPTAAQIEAVTEATKKGGKAIHESPVTGLHQMFQINRVYNEHSMAAVRKAMRTGMSFRHAMGEFGDGDLAEIFGGKIAPSTILDSSKVHSMDITPAMRDTARREGFPLFQAAPAPSSMGGNLGVQHPGMVDILTDSNHDLIERLKGATSTAAIQASLDSARTALQDRLLPLLRVQQQIEALKNATLPDEQNAYVVEETFSGRAGDRLQQFQIKFKKPLLDAIHAAGLSNAEGLARIQDYLYARHAPERNAAIKEINQDLDAGSGMTDAAAATIIAQAKADGLTAKLDEIAKLHDAIHKETMRSRVADGLMSQADADKWAKVYHHYTPLRGRGDLAENGVDRPRPGQGYSVRGTESKRAMGRSSRAKDLLAYSLMQAEEAIIRGEKNRVGQSLLALVRANPDPSYWEVGKLETKRRINAEGQVEDFDQSKSEIDPNVIVVKEKGESTKLWIADERLAANLKNLDAGRVHLVVRLLARLNRFLSLVNTGWNLKFVITNALRDLQGANLNLAGLGKGKLVGSVLIYYPRVWRAVWGGLEGKGDTAMQKRFREYAAAGGKVDFWNADDVSKQRSHIEAELRNMNRSYVNPLRFGRATFALIERANQTVENSIRFSVYMAARDAGATTQQAASLSKNITVNFNRRGELSPWLNALYLFYNASVQGSAMMGKLMTSKKGWTILGAVMAAGLAEDLLNGAFSPAGDDGEDQYDKIPDFVKERNAVIMLPNGSYVKIPLPYGFNAFHQMGRNLGAYMRGARSIGSATGNALQTFVDAFNPVGDTNSILNFFAPTVLDPIVDIAQNEDYSGRPIMPTANPYGPPEPDSQRYFANVSTISKVVADRLNEITGGDDFHSGAIDISPETFDYYAAWLGGGAFTFFKNGLVDLGKKAWNGEPIDGADLPLASAVIGRDPDTTDIGRLYDRLQEIELATAQIKQDIRAGDKEAAAEDRAKRGALVALRGTANATRDQLKDIRNAIKATEASTKLDETARAAKLQRLKERQKAIIDAFNSAYAKRVGQ